MRSSFIIFIISIFSLSSFGKEVVRCESPFGTFVLHTSGNIELINKKSSCRGSVESYESLFHAGGFHYGFKFFIGPCHDKKIRNRHFEYHYYNIESERTNVVSDKNSKIKALPGQSKNCEVKFVNSQLFKVFKKNN